MITGARITHISLLLDRHWSQESGNCCSPVDTTLINHENAQNRLKQSSLNICLFKYCSWCKCCFIVLMLNDNGGVVREAFKKKTQKSLEIFQTGGGVSAKSKLFFGFFWVFSKSFGKTLEMAWFIQKCKEKKFTFVRGGGTLYCTVPYCTKLYSTAAKYGLKIFFLQIWMN